MRNTITILSIALFCGACGNRPVQQVNTIGANLSVELSIRMEVNDSVKDSHRALFALPKGSVIPARLTITGEDNVHITFDNFRMKDGNAEFDSWGFDGFTPLTLENGTTVTTGQYSAKQADGFSIPVDGSQQLDSLLTFLDMTAINSENINVYVTLNIKN